MDSKTDLMRKDEFLYPHSPDVIERETSDNGFSKGWGMHFLPSEKYWVDVHTHMELKNYVGLNKAIEGLISHLNMFDVKCAVAILPMMDENDEKNNKQLKNPYFLNKEKLNGYLSKIQDNNQLRYMLYMDYKKPDSKLIEDAVDLGICGIKLHNAQTIIEGGDHEIWLSDEWRKVFKTIEKAGVPVLWHVTQRLTDSPYTGGGRNTYWKEGWKKGVKYTNEDLLQVFLKIVKEYPGISFIAAHQLHLGWERLTGLFEQYANLHTDTTIGCYVRRYDELYEADRLYLRNIFIKYNEQILFGTDIEVEDNSPDGYIYRAYDGHIRFMKQLRLPDNILQKISHENAERLFNL